MTDEQNPTLYQFRTRPTTDDKHPWSKWIECTKSDYEGFLKTPVMHDFWAYEARALYTRPDPSVVRQPLTEEQIALISADCALVTPSDFYFARAIERAHGIGGSDES